MPAKRPRLLLLALVSCVLALTACGQREQSESADTTATESAATAAPATESSATEASPAAQPAAEPKGTARVSVRGDGVNIDGEFPATRCGEAAMGTSGVVYETRPPGWTLSVMNWDHRLAGRQSGPQGEKTGLIMNGTDGRSITSSVAAGAEITFGDDFKTARANATANAIGSQTPIEIQAEFTCR